MNKVSIKHFFTGLGLFALLFIGNAAMAQHALTHASSGDKWLVSEQAEAVSLSEIDNLTSQLSQMTAGGASQEDIAKVQFQLAVYYHIVQVLKQGKSTQESYQHTWATMGDGDDASMMTPAEKQAFRDATRSKLTE